jgi:hypothetical protein
VAVSTWQAVRATRAEAMALAAQRAAAARAEGERLAKLEADARRIEAERQKRRAEAGEHLAGERLAQVEAERKKAEEEKQIAVAVNDFLQHKLLGQADVTVQADALVKAGGLTAEAKKDPTIRELLDRAAEELSEAKIEANFPNQPLLQAEILNTVGITYRGVGEYGRAIGFLQRSLALREAELGPEHPDTLHSMTNLASVYQDAGKLDQALPLCEEALRLQKEKLGPEHPSTLITMNNLAIAYEDAGKQDLALPLFEGLLKVRKAKFGAEHPGTLHSMTNLATAYHLAGKPDLALSLIEETLKLMKAKLGPEHPHTLTTMNNLALAYEAAGKLDLALSLFEETLKLKKAKLGPEHPDTLATMTNLAAAYLVAGKLDLALPLNVETLKFMKAKLGPEHPHTLTTMDNLAILYEAAEKLDLALPLFEETLKLKKAKLGRKHPETLAAMKNLARMYQAAGRMRGALRHLATASAANPKDNELSLKVAALQAWFAEDEELAATRQRILAFAKGTDEWTTAERAAKACSLFPSTDQAGLEAALDVARTGVKLFRGEWTLLAVGMAEYRSGNHTAAAEALLAATEAGPNNPRVTGIAAFYRAMSLFRQDKPGEARQLAIAAAATMKPLPADEQNPMARTATPDDLILWLAYKEANALIQFDAATPPMRERLP